MENFGQKESEFVIVWIPVQCILNIEQFLNAMIASKYMVRLQIDGFSLFIMFFVVAFMIKPRRLTINYKVSMTIRGGASRQGSATKGATLSGCQNTKYNYYLSRNL